MNGYGFSLGGAALTALPSGALWWEERRLLAVSDLHLGKSERTARRGLGLLPPYETEDTLARLDAEISAWRPATVLCLGDSFDDLDAAAALDRRHALWLVRLMAGRRWLWIEGNHDPGPIDLGGSHLAEHREGGIVFRHIAQDAGEEAEGEVSGHYHPKTRIAGRSRPCFLVDSRRLVLPAFGTFTGGLDCSGGPLDRIMGQGALALVLGRRVTAVPMRGDQKRPSALTASS
jgi:DNA ligase-associated metallophosphoesterase